MELWKDIPGFGGRYQASNIGRLAKIIDGNRIIVHQTITRGYCVAVLRIHTDDRRGKQIRVHRLIALTWICNPEGKPYIDHINGIKNDNRIENLRWCTPLENSNNPNTKYKTGPGRREVLQYSPRDLNYSTPIKSFIGLKEAADSVGAISSTLVHSIKNHSLTYGYRWGYGSKVYKYIQER